MDTDQTTYRHPVSAAEASANLRALNALHSRASTHTETTDSLASLLAHGKRAMGFNAGEASPFSAQPAVSGVVRLSDVVAGLSGEGTRQFGDRLNQHDASAVLTLRGLMAESSAVVRAGGQIVPIKASPEAVRDSQGTAATYIQASKLSLIRPAPFSALAEGADLPASALPVAVDEIANAATGVPTHGARFVLPRSVVRDMTDGELSAVVIRSVALGLGQIIDRVLLAKILAATPGAFTLAKLAASGIRWAGARALVGTAAAGAAGVEGSLYVSGMPAVLTDQMTATLVGDWTRVGAALVDEATVVIRRIGTGGSLEASVFAECGALAPDAASNFWTVAA